MENVLDLFSPAGQRMALQAKLKREFEEPSTLFSNQMFREDIYYMLILSDWSDEVVRRLIQIPNLLWTVAWTRRPLLLFYQYIANCAS